MFKYLAAVLQMISEDCDAMQAERTAWTSLHVVMRFPYNVAITTGEWPPHAAVDLVLLRMENLGEVVEEDSAGEYMVEIVGSKFQGKRDCELAKVFQIGIMRRVFLERVE